MPFIPAPNDTWRCSIRYSLLGQLLVNVIHVVDLNSAYNAQGVADTVFDAWTSATIGAGPAGGPVQSMAANVQCLGVSAQYMAVAGGAIADSTASPVSGSSGTAVSNQLAHVATLRTGFGGRSFRGRIYLPPPPSSVVTVDANHVTSGYAGDVAQRCENVLTRLATWADPLEWVVTSYFTANAPRAVAVNTPITSITVNTRLDSQRRRMPAA